MNDRLPPTAMRPLTHGDLERWLALQAYIADPYDMSSLREELNLRQSRTLCFAEAGQLLGALLAWLVVDELQIMQVIVVPDDPTMQGPWLFVADLSQKEETGYPVRVVDRFELEKKVEASRPAPKPKIRAASAGAGEVILYRTSWCGYCEKAGEYLRLKGVPFVSKDIEREPGARQDMMQRAAKAGVPASQLQGVPILYIKGRILSGFSREAIDAALQGG